MAFMVPVVRRDMDIFAHRSKVANKRNAKVSVDDAKVIKLSAKNGSDVIVWKPSPTHRLSVEIRNHQHLKSIASSLPIHFASLSQVSFDPGQAEDARLPKFRNGTPYTRSLDRVVDKVVLCIPDDQRSMVSVSSLRSNKFHNRFLDRFRKLLKNNSSNPSP